MAKLIWLSDLHYTAEGLVLGHDPRRRLTLAIDYINKHYSDAEYCLISGDLVNRGSPADYLSLKDHLDRLRMLYFPMVGNHDDRELVKDILPVPQSVMPGFVQYTLETERALLVCLDTQKTGSDAGSFCGERLEWLRATFERYRDTPIYIFMHHPPMPLGLPMQDQDRLLKSEALLDLICTSPDVSYLFIGHVHRSICGMIRGIPYATMRSVLYQAPPPLPAWDWESFSPGREAPAMGVLDISECGSVNLQYIQFCDFLDGVSSGVR